MLTFRVTKAMPVGTWLGAGLRLGGAEGDGASFDEWEANPWADPGVVGLL